MRFCDKCGIGFTGSLEHCPLCGNALVGKPTPEAFPVQRIKTPARAARTSICTLTIAAMACVIVIGILGGIGALHIAFACGALVVNCVFLCNIVARVPDFLRIAERWFLALLAISILCWWAFGLAWMGRYVIPSICLTATIVNTLLLSIFGNSFVHGYAKYLLYDIVLGLLPLVFVLIGWIDWIWLAVASAAAALLLTLMLVLLARKQLVSEIRKLFTA